MMKHARRRWNRAGTPVACAEILEPRQLLSASLLGTATLPGAANMSWNYADGAYNASALMTGQTGLDTNILLTVGGDGNLYGYNYNPGTNQLELYGGSNQTPAAVPPIQSTPAVADIPGVGRAIFAGAVDGTVYAWDIATGQLLTGWPATVAIPGELQPAAGLSNAIYGAVTTADLDGDGSPEILITSMNHELTVFHADGTVAWRFNNDAAIVGGAAVGDLDGDGQLEVVLAGGSDANTYYAAGGRLTVLTADGKRIWVRQMSQPIDSSPSLADLDGDGRLDIVVGTGFRQRDAGGGGNRVYAIDADGRDLPGWPYVTLADSSIDAGVFSSPAIGDIDQDGTLDVVVGDALGRVHAIRGNGQALWVTQGFNTSIYSTALLADVDGDQVLDAVVAAGSSVRAFSGLNGSTVFDYTDNTGQEIYRTTPAVGHLTGNSSLQLAFVGEKADTNHVLAPSILKVYTLAASSVAPAWSMARQDARGYALTRTPAQADDLMMAVFGQVLGRSPRSDEVETFGREFVHAPRLQEAIQTIVGSAEARQRIINNWYVSFLGRPGEAAGVSYWQSYLAAGHSYAEAESPFLGSDEAFNLAGGTNASWVAYMYQKLLGRMPSDSETAVWAGALAAGTVQRADVVHGFLFSQELTERQVRNWYLTYVPGGQFVPGDETLRAAGWDLRRGITEERVLTRILESSGNYIITQQEDRVVRTLYQDLLGREAAPAEVIVWLGALEGGVNIGGVAQTIASSYEYRDRLVAGYYQDYLGRSSTAEERAYWVNALGAGMLRSTLISGFLSSDEYYARAGGTVTGFINRAWTDVLGHGALPENFTDWAGQAAAGTPIRALLPQALLRSAEYATRQIATQYWRYLRHLPTVSPDGSATVPVGTPYGAAYWLGYLTQGGTPEAMEMAVVSSTEYITLVGNRALWTGVRWQI